MWDKSVARGLILSALDASRRALTAPEILEYVRDRRSTIETSTVYSTLYGLVEDNLVKKITEQPHCVLYFRSMEQWVRMLTDVR